ncbi:hypothetical protein MHU86_11803 [Fragilaria crotonensis]|nr:hypothetical protein MHU86_11803 [Fragilaria crotonensis]
MVDPKRSSRGTKGSLHPQTAAALSAPPLGYKAPPPLLDFVSPDEYYSHKAHESVEAENLRLARYYRNHLENHAKIDGFLMQTISAVETALAQTHPSFFDLSLNDMDSYLLGLKQPAEQNTAMDIDSADSSDKEIISSLRTAATLKLSTAAATESPAIVLQESSQSSSDEPPTTQADAVVYSTKRNKSSSTTTSSITGATVTSSSSTTTATDQPKATDQPSLTHQVRRPSAIKHVVRVETRWAQKISMSFGHLRQQCIGALHRSFPALIPITHG